MVRNASGSTIVSLHVEGLTPGGTYASHVHAAPCAVGAADGHYKHDPAGPADPTERDLARRWSLRRQRWRHRERSGRRGLHRRCERSVGRGPRPLAAVDRRTRWPAPTWVDGSAAASNRHVRRCGPRSPTSARTQGLTIEFPIYHDLIMSRSPKPLPAASLHIVLALLDGELHGYALMRRVAELSDGAVKMGPGTLYGTLNRLVDEGLIVETTDRADRTESERRRYYELTADRPHGGARRVGPAPEPAPSGQAGPGRRGDRMNRDPVAVRVYGAVTRLYPRQFRDELRRRHGLAVPRPVPRRIDVARGVRARGRRPRDHDPDPAPGGNDAQNPEPTRPDHLPGDRRSADCSSPPSAAATRRPRSSASPSRSAPAPSA